MVAVFAIFAGTGIPQIKEIGVGLAVAIALDATVVRLILVPTTMEMMGDANWWLPRWLDRHAARHGLRVLRRHRKPAPHGRVARMRPTSKAVHRHRLLVRASGARPPSGWPQAAGPSTRPRAARSRSRTSRPQAARRSRSTSTARSRCAPRCETVEEAEGAIGALVNNAGIQEIGAIETLPMDRVRGCSRPTSSGRCGSTQLVLPGMRKAGARPDRHRRLDERQVHLARHRLLLRRPSTRWRRSATPCATRCARSASTSC